MFKLLSLFLLLACTLKSVSSTPLFEPALDTWTLDDTDGKVSLKQKCGMDGQRPCLLIEGSTDVNTYALSPTIPDEMSNTATFLLRAVVKATAKVYLEIDGVSFEYTPGSSSLAIATNKTDLADGWIEISSMVRLRENTERRIKIGISRKDGTCYVDSVTLAQTSTVPVAEDTSYPAIAQDEAVYANGTFVSNVFAERYCASMNRHITHMSAKWDASRAIFSKKRNITFDYSDVMSLLKEPLTVELAVQYVSTSAAYLALTESKDGGKTWTEVGTFGSKVDTFAFTLSSAEHSMFCVKIASSEGSIYVNKIRVSSTVKDKPRANVYGRQVVQVTHEENGLSLVASEKLDSKRSFVVKLTNTGNSSIDNFKIEYTRTIAAGPSITAEKTGGSLKAGESMSVPSKIMFSGSDNNVVHYSVRSSDGTTTYASGLFVTTRPHFFDDESFGNYVAEDSKCGTLWWCGSTHKVSKGRAAPEKSTEKRAIDLYAAKNEFEAFQLVLKASSSSDRTISDVSVSTLTSVDDSSTVITNVSVRRVMYVKTEFATDEDYGRAGEYWPDPLLPLDLPYTCPAGENCPFWVLVYVPFDAKEGSYKGTVSLTAGGKKLSADVSLKVWNFTIPKKQRMKSLFGVEVNPINYYHHLTESSNEIGLMMYNKYLDSLSKHRISPMYGYAYHWPSTKYTDGELVFKRFDRYINRLKELHSEDTYGFSVDVVKLFGINEDIGDYARGSKEHKKLFAQSTKHIYDLLKNNSLLDDMYVYWFDEPDEEDYDEVIEWNDEIKKSAPDLKVLLTEQVEDALKGHVDAWCPVFSNYVKDDLVERQKLGEEAWTYVCCCPKGKRITLFIDHPATELRLWNWHSFKNNIDGILLWEMAYWSKNYTYLQDPYTDPMSWSRTSDGMWGNGDGRFFYPPVNWKENFSQPLYNDPVETVRLENLRDGLEDWEYFTTLKEISTSKDATREQKAIAKKLLSIPNYIVNTNDKEYAVTPEDFLAQRNEVGRFINGYFCGEEYSNSFIFPIDESASSMIRPISFFTVIILLMAIAFVKK